MPDAPPPRLVYDALLITSYHDFYKPAVSARVTGLGLGAALLAELLLSGHVTVASRDGDDVVAPDRNLGPPSESLGLWLVELVRSEHDEVTVREWIEYLAVAGVYEKTAEHMVVAGLMVRNEHKSRWRQRTHVEYNAADALIAQAPLVRLRRHLSTLDRRMSLVDTFLIALTEAVGLVKPLYAQTPAGAREYAQNHVRVLPAPLQAIRGHLTAAVAETAISGGL